MHARPDNGKSKTRQDLTSAIKKDGRVPLCLFQSPFCSLFAAGPDIFFEGQFYERAFLRAYVFAPAVQRNEGWAIGKNPLSAGKSFFVAVWSL